MSIKTNAKTTSQDESLLYLLVGEALCMIQLLEGALSTSITLKKDVRHPHRISMGDADNFLERYRSITLGRALKLAKQHNLYSDTLYNDLTVLLEERNWLVRKFLHHYLDDIHVNEARKKIFHRIKNISNVAKMLQKAIEEDLIIYSELVGKDMSRVRAFIKQASKGI
jgi:hypothetical protein